MKDALGDRMKGYEERFTNDTFLPLLPIIIRLDGKSFHTFCKHLIKPFDQYFHSYMVETARFLFQEVHPVIAYTQSDEITLVLYHDNPDSQIYFGGKLFKIISICASVATAAFNDLYRERCIGRHTNPAFFDCRAFQVPTLWEAVNALIWREMDATRNSILSAAQFHFSHKEIQGLNLKQLQEKLFEKKNINWNDYPNNQKRGTYLRSNEENKIDVYDIPVLHKIENAPDVIFNGAKPIMKEGSR